MELPPRVRVLGSAPADPVDVGIGVGIEGSIRHLEIPPVAGREDLPIGQILEQDDVPRSMSAPRSTRIFDRHFGGLRGFIARATGHPHRADRGQ